MKNELKRKIECGKVVLGAYVSFQSVEVVEIMGRMGFDWLTFDTEHTPMNDQVINNLLAGLKGSDTTPLVRVAWNDPVMIKKVLDIGAQGVIVPWVNSREEAERAVQACKYPPRGIRGMGPGRPADYGLTLTEYVESADQEIMVIPQIETQKAVENVEEILLVEGVNAFIVGPADLSMSLGIPFQLEHPKFLEAIDKVLEASRSTGKTPGFFTLPNTARHWASLGFRLLGIGGDSTFVVKGAIDTLRDLDDLRK